MRKYIKILVVSAFSWLVPASPLPASAAQEQTPAKSKFTSVIGEVTAIDAGAQKIDLKADAGGAKTVHLGDATSYLRVPPGEKDLKKATRINLADINVGDRVLARVRTDDETGSSPANSVIVINKAELAQYHEKTAAEWRTRGMAGKISAIDPTKKEVTIQVQTHTGMKDVVVDASGAVSFRRYSPESVRFADAKPGTFNDLAVGNNLRVLGDKNDDGSRIKAEEVVSGSFRNIAGTILSIDAAAGEIKITDLSNKKPLTIKVNSDSSLKKLEPATANMLARIRQASAGGNAAGGPRQGVPGGDAAEGYTGRRTGPGPEGPRPEGGRPAAGAPGARTEGPPAGPGIMAAAGASGPGGGPRMRGNMDFQQVLERSPSITLADLKAGDALIISSTAGSEATKAMAIMILAGVEPLLTAAPVRAGQDPLGGTWSLDMSMPTQ
jgi:Cu/Ag efflux protein CusF